MPSSSAVAKPDCAAAPGSTQPGQNRDQGGVNVASWYKTAVGAGVGIGGLGVLVAVAVGDIGVSIGVFVAVGVGPAMSGTGVAVGGGGLGVASTGVLVGETMADNLVLAASGAPSPGGRSGQVRS